MKRTRASAFSLVEVALALGIVSFVLVTLLALLPVGLNTAKESSDENIASNALLALAADIRNIRPGETGSTLYGIPVWDETAPATGTLFLEGNGDRANTAGAKNYAARWTIYRSAASPVPVTQVHLEIAWPGAAPNPANWVETVVTLGKRRP